MNRKFHFLFFVIASTLAFPAISFGQAVEVTARLDNSRIALGGTTVLHVYAQVIPDLRATSDRIFSWYVDLLDLGGSVAQAQYGAISKSTSDNDPSTSSSGTTDGANRRGIYDTFLNLEGAGVSAPVEIFSVPVTGMAPGTAHFQVAEGSGVPGLKHDFIVAPSEGGDFLSGGDYSLAFADLDVLEQCALQLSIQRLPSGDLELSFPLCAAINHTVESRSALGGDAVWQALPGAPHNSGVVTIPAPTVSQYFRVRIDPVAP